MKNVKGINKKGKSNASAGTKSVIICRHCKKRIDKVKMVGLSLICPSCRKPQNGS